MISGKNIIFFISGAAIGGVLGVFYMKKRCKDEVDKEIQKFLAEFYASNEENEVKNETSESDGGGDFSKTIDSYEGGKADGGKPLTNYSSFYKESGDMADYMHPTEDDDDEDEVGDDSDDILDGTYNDDELVEKGFYITEENENDVAGEEMTAEMNSGKRPKLITAESYDNEYAHFDKIELEYYTDDDVLVDIAGEEEIHDPNRIVGDCLDKFGFRDNPDETVIFVRNFDHGADYEISKVFSSFYGE